MKRQKTSSHSDDEDVPRPRGGREKKSEDMKGEGRGGEVKEFQKTRTKMLTRWMRRRKRLRKYGDGRERRGRERRERKKIGDDNDEHE